MESADQSNPPNPFVNPLQETGTCAICGNNYGHYGNNPEPLLPYERRVCDDCNAFVVIPARLGTKVTIHTYDGKRIIFHRGMIEGTSDE